MKNSWVIGSFRELEGRRGLGSMWLSAKAIRQGHLVLQSRDSGLDLGS